MYYYYVLVLLWWVICVITYANELGEAVVHPYIYHKLLN